MLTPGRRRLAGTRVRRRRLEPLPRPGAFRRGTVGRQGRSRRRVRGALHRRHPGRAPDHLCPAPPARQDPEPRRGSCLYRQLLQSRHGRAERSRSGPHRPDRIMDGKSAARHQNGLGTRSQTVSLSRTIPRRPEQHSLSLVACIKRLPAWPRGSFPSQNGDISDVPFPLPFFPPPSALFVLAAASRPRDQPHSSGSSSR